MLHPVRQGLHGGAGRASRARRRGIMGAHETVRLPPRVARLKHGACALCARVTRLTFHHLIPRKMHRRPRFRKRHSREELNAGVDLCPRCHRGVHRLHDEMTLASSLNTLEALREDEAVARHVAWVARQKS